MKKKIPFMESFFIKRHIRPRKYKTKEKLSMNPLRYPGAKSKYDSKKNKKCDIIFKCL